MSKCNIINISKIPTMNGISFGEVRILLPKDISARDRLQFILANFFDKDGNGWLDSKEFGNFLKESKFYIKDGVLSSQEIDAINNQKVLETRYKIKELFKNRQYNSLEKINKLKEYPATVDVIMAIKEALSKKDQDSAIIQAALDVSENILMRAEKFNPKEHRQGIETLKCIRNIALSDSYPDTIKEIAGAVYKNVVKNRPDLYEKLQSAK